MLIIAHSDDPIVAFLRYQEKKAQSLHQSDENVVQTPSGRQNAGAASAYKKAFHESGMELPPRTEQAATKQVKPRTQPPTDPTRSYDSVVPDTPLNLKNLFK